MYLKVSNIIVSNKVYYKKHHLLLLFSLYFRYLKISQIKLLFYLVMMIYYYYYQPNMYCIQYCYIILDKKIFVMIVPVLIKKKHFGVYFLSHDFTDFLCIKLLYSIQAKMTFYDFVTSKWYIIVCTLHVLYFFSRFR